MTAAAVTITDFQTEIPGKLIDNGKTWEFPPVTYTATKGAQRYFRVLAQARTAADDPKTAARITPAFYEPGKFPATKVAVFWTASGQEGGKQTDSAVNVVRAGKNLGKKNETTPWTQALRDALSRYRKAENKQRPAEGADAPHGNAADGIDVNTAVPPMLLKKYDDYPVREWPQILQVKYNGVRAMVYKVDPHVLAQLQKKSRQEDIDRAKELGVAVVSRTMVVIPAWPLARELKPFFRRYPAVALDGELVAYNESGELLPLQDISGMARNADRAGGLEIVLFDIYNREDAAMRFEDRWEFLEDNRARVESEIVMLAETAKVADEAAANRAHARHLREGHEGSIVRDPGGIYIPSFNTARSNEVLKWKPRLAEEFEIVGYDSGRKGKCADALMWKVRIPPHTNGSDRAEAKDITIDPKDMSFDERRELLARLRGNPRMFEAQYRGRMMTVEFFDWSKDGIPQQPKAVTVRYDI
jgi:hypothetical protein